MARTPKARGLGWIVLHAARGLTLSGSLILMLACVAPETTHETPVELHAEQVTLERGQADSFALMLESGEYVRIEAAVSRGDIALKITGPDQEKITGSDGGAERVAEQVSWIAPTSGTFLLTVTTRSEAAQCTFQLYKRSRDPRNRFRVEGDRYFLSSYHAKKSGRSQEALEGYEQAIKSWRKAEDPEWQALTLNRRGLYQKALGEPEAARKDYEEAFEILSGLRPEEIEWPDLRIEIQRNLADLERDGGDFEAADAWYSRLLGELKARESTVNNLRLLARHGRAWGVFLRKSGDLEESRLALERAHMREVEGHSEPSEIANTQTQLGKTLRALGRLREARKAYEEAGLAVQNPELRATINNNLGVVELLDGRFELAAQNFLEVLEFHHEAPPSREKARVLLNLASAYSRAGRPEKARERLAESISVFQGAMDPVGEVEASVKMAWYVINQGENSAIRTQIEELSGLLSLSKELPPASTASVYGALGSAWLRLEEWGAAIEALEKAVALAEEGDRVRAAQSRVLLGEALYESGRGDEVEKRLGGPENDEAYAGLPAADAARLHLLALLNRTRDRDLCENFFKLAIERVELLRELLPSTELRATFFARKRRIYEDYADWLVRDVGTELAVQRAFEISERAHARSLFELVQAQAAEVHGDSRSKEARDLTELRRQRRALQSQIWDVTHAGSDKKALRKELLELNSKILRLTRETPAQDRALASLSPQEPFSVQDLQSRLDSETAVLEYLVGADKAWLFVVRKESISALPIEAKGLEKLVDFLFNFIDSQKVAGRISDFAEISRMLHGRVLGPALGELQGTSRWIIIPDGPLHRLPFEMLMSSDRPVATTSWREQPFLLKEKRISYAPSAAVILALAERPAALSRGRLVVFGPPDKMPAGLSPLSGAVSETKELIEANEKEGFEVVSHLGDRAFEASLKEPGSIRPGDRLHFASHTLMRGERPQLVLGASGSEDGLLELHELLRLDLPADLVTLAACETHGREPIHGEGLMGLSRGFLGSGARRVLASFVEVHDFATRELMVSFYRDLEDSSAVDALRKAKIDLIERGRAHPYYWSPFILIGDPT